MTKEGTDGGVGLIRGGVGGGGSGDGVRGDGGVGVLLAVTA